MRQIKLYAVLFSFAALFFCSSCGFFEARETKHKIADVRIGMTHEEVRNIMGQEPKGSFQRKNVLFYYTDPKWYDGYVTRDECTPFVFDENEDRLIGFGYEYFLQSDLEIR